MPHVDDYQRLVCYIPTLQMAMKWLREAHGLDIDISIEYTPKKTYYYSVLKKTVIRDIDCLHSETNFKSYEEACESAIKYCLENLIQKPQPVYDEKGNVKYYKDDEYIYIRHNGELLGIG